MTSQMNHRITSLEQLEALYGPTNPNSLRKEIGYIHPHYKKLIEAAPFVVLASAGPEGLDCGPRGDAPGFVRVVDEQTLQIPDRRGNNRLDTLKNILRDDRVALLFLIPGIGETLRVNGRAAIVADPELIESFAVNGKPPFCIIEITVESIYFHCSKAMVRSRLWDPARQLPRTALPSTGTIVEALTKGEVSGADYDREAPARIQAQLY